MKSIRYFYLATLALSFGSLSASAAGPEGAETVSIVQLLAVPEKYEGKLVSVRGFVRLESEGSAIYLHEEDYEQSLYSNGLWLNAGECCRLPLSH